MPSFKRFILVLVTMWSLELPVRWCTGASSYNCSIGETRCEVIDASECKSLHDLSDGQPIPFLDSTSFLKLILIEFPEHQTRFLQVELPCHIECPLPVVAFTTSTINQTILSITAPSRHYNDLRKYIPYLLPCSDKPLADLEKSSSQGPDAWEMGDCPYLGKDILGKESELTSSINSRLKVASQGEYQLWVDCISLDMRTGRPKSPVTIRTPTFTVPEHDDDCAIAVLWEKAESPELGPRTLEWLQPQEATDKRQEATDKRQEATDKRQEATDKPQEATDNKGETEDIIAIIAACVSGFGLLVLVAGVLVLYKKMVKKQSSERNVRCHKEMEPSSSPTPSSHRTVIRTQPHCDNCSLHSSHPSLTPWLHRFKLTSLSIKTDSSNANVEKEMNDEMDSDSLMYCLSPSMKALHSSLHLHRPFHDYDFPHGFEQNIARAFYDNHCETSEDIICHRRSDDNVEDSRNSTNEKGISKTGSNRISDSTNDNYSTGYYSYELPPLKEPRANLRYEGSMSSIFFNDLLRRYNGDWPRLVSNYPCIEHHSDECISLTDSVSYDNVM